MCKPSPGRLKEGFVPDVRGKRNRTSHHQSKHITVAARQAEQGNLAVREDRTLSGSGLELTCLRHAGLSIKKPEFRAFVSGKGSGRKGRSRRSSGSSRNKQSAYSWQNGGRNDTYDKTQKKWLAQLGRIPTRCSPAPDGRGMTRGRNLWETKPWHAGYPKQTWDWNPCVELGKSEGRAASLE